jgi:radical SAM protein with 4Fe4S-binding SPASM domain
LEGFLLKKTTCVLYFDYETQIKCRRFYSPVGKVPEGKIFDIFFNSKMERYRNINLFEKCENCFLKCYCRGCRAMAYEILGDWRKADPQCWR